MIAGPTASGKTALAIELSKMLGARIVNADSMQIYRDLHILSARPSREEEAQAPHVLFGHVPSHEAYSVMRWLSDFEVELEAARKEEVPLIVVGGTGLYFKALLEGISLMPEISQDIRQYWREESCHKTAEYLHSILREKDPVVAARLKEGDTQRIVRALEVIEGTGKSLSYWQQNRSTPLLGSSDHVSVVLAPERKALHERIHRRFELMMEAGAEQEAVALTSQGLDPSLTVMKAIGVKQLSLAAAGEVLRDAAIERSKTETRQYAKRQMTFFNGQLPMWPQLDPLNAADREACIDTLGKAFAK